MAQVKFNKKIEVTELRSTLSEYGFKGAEIVEFGSPNEVLIKTQISGSTTEISEKLTTALGDTFIMRRVESVGPKIGKELQADALKAISLALLMILIYIAFRFDRYYALGSVMALIHDVLITLGSNWVETKTRSVAVLEAREKPQSPPRKCFQRNHRNSFDRAG